MRINIKTVLFKKILLCNSSSILQLFYKNDKDII